MKNEMQWGLIACGSSGETSIDIDEGISDSKIYEFEITKAKWTLRFRISNTIVVTDLLNFLRNKNNQEFHIGNFNEMKVIIKWDSEFSDRLFISINGPSGYLDYTISGNTEINELIFSCEQVVKDLQW